MGDGQVTGNQSVHWSIDHEKGGQKVPVRANEARRPRAGDDFEVSHDTKLFGRDPKNNVKEFVVTLRFESKDSATKQLQDALRAVEQAAPNTSFFLNFTVPAMVNGVPRQNPEDPPGPDIRFRW
jgi:hypothetical protein